MTTGDGSWAISVRLNQHWIYYVEYINHHLDDRYHPNHGSGSKCLCCMNNCLCPNIKIVIDHKPSSVERENKEENKRKTDYHRPQFQSNPVVYQGSGSCSATENSIRMWWKMDVIADSSSVSLYYRSYQGHPEVRLNHGSDCQ